jgi:hydroxyacylglutathione hydrolase
VIFPHVVVSVRSQLLPAASVFGGAVFQDLGVAAGFTVGLGHGLAAAGAADADADGEAPADAAADGVLDGAAPEAVDVPEPVFRSSAAPIAMPRTTMTVTPMAMALRWALRRWAARCCCLAAHFSYRRLAYSRSRLLGDTRPPRYLATHLVPCAGPVASVGGRQPAPVEVDQVVYAAGVLVVGFPALAFATNCYVVAPAAGQECVVVDPGIGVEDRLAEVLDTHRLRPAAVLLTHGHVDHVYAVTPVCSAHGVAASIHADDAYRLADPLATLDPGVLAMFEQQFGARARWREPDDVVRLTDGQRLDIAGLQVDVVHAPGHTEGSVMFALPAAPDGPLGQDAAATLVAGDVLFAGSIGRTDLPGGDPEAMARSLAAKVLPLADDTLVLPGHGPSTTVGRERRSNPFLLELAHSA